MAKLSEIVDHTSKLLEFELYSDQALNGLQVEGKAEVTKIVAAVDAALETAKMAIDSGADILLVHHGIFWGKDVAVTGPRKELLKLLFEKGVSLFAAHIPLDAHQEFGNNFQLATQLGLRNPKQFLPYNGRLIGCLAENTDQQSRGELVGKMQTLPGAHEHFTCLEFGPEIPKTIGICSGSAMYSVERFAEDGFDTFITGEPKQFAYHFAKENNLNVYCPGHYATETLGVCALAKHLSKKFSVTWEFIDAPTGI